MALSKNQALFVRNNYSVFQKKSASRPTQLGKKNLDGRTFWCGLVNCQRASSGDITRLVRSISRVSPSDFSLSFEGTSFQRTLTRVSRGLKG